MKQIKIYLYVFYALLAMLIFALASCASDDLAVTDGGLQGDGMSLGIDVSQIQGGDATRAQLHAPAIKTYQMRTSGKPMFVLCSSEAYIDRHVDSHANASQASGAGTRGVSITSDTFYDQFGLFYYDYAKTDTWANVATTSATPTANNIPVEKSNGWHTDRYWPGKDHKLTFMAYAPYDADYKNPSGVSYIQFPSNITGYPTITYTVPDKVEDQQDLLVSAETATQDMAGDYNKVVGLKFYHTLSAINFKIGSIMAPGRIAKIEVKGVYNQGTFDFGTKQWSNISGSADYSITPNYIIGDQRGVVFTGVDDDKNDLMLVMPQTVPAGAKIVVTIEDGANYANSHEMELPIDGHEWLAGYTITYSLSTSEENSDYIFSVSKINSIDKDECTVNYKVSSYVQSYYGSQTPVGWKAKYAVDDQIETKDDYTEELGDVVTGGFVFNMPTSTATTSAMTADIAALEPPISDPEYNSHTATLRARTSIGTEENPYDLSTFGGTKSQNTANCYVINAPGWYKFPLVYGNCIKDGENNTVVYGTTNTTFVNHLNKTITSPYLKENAGVVPADAVLVWQDAYQMIDVESVTLSDDTDYLIFKVNPDKICQGNALLSVRDASKKILWNWHIWVTDETISSATAIPVTNAQGSVYGFMKVPLGYCDVDRRRCKPRRIKFKFEQEISNKVADVTFDQSSTYYMDIGINAPYYQWGRSVPLRIQNGLTLESKCMYMGEDYVMDAVASVTTTGNAIQNPFRDYYNNSNGEWNSKRGINNYWDVNCAKAGVYDKSTNKSIKTIYDPSPVGYKVPETAAYSSFTPETSYKFYSPTLCNVSGTWDNGWHFYTQPSQKGSTIFIPMLGYYWKNKFIINDGCGYHLAGPSLTNPTNYGCGLGFLENTISSCANSQRALALNIYSVTDD